MEYAAALEVKSTQQEGRILELEDTLDGRTTVTLPPELAASATTSTATASAAATKMAAMRALIQSLEALVTALTTKSTTDGGGGLCCEDGDQGCQALDQRLYGCHFGGGSGCGCGGHRRARREFRRQRDCSTPVQGILQLKDVALLLL